MAFRKKQKISMSIGIKLQNVSPAFMKRNYEFKIPIFEDINCLPELLQQLPHHQMLLIGDQS